MISGGVEKTRGMEWVNIFKTVVTAKTKSDIRKG